MKAKSTLVFGLGLGTGALIAANWQQLVKKAIQTSVIGTKKVTIATVRATGSFSDVIQEARAEILEQSRNGSKASSR